MSNSVFIVLLCIIGARQQLVEWIKHVHSNLILGCFLDRTRKGLFFSALVLLLSACENEQLRISSKSTSVPNEIPNLINALIQDGSRSCLLSRSVKGAGPQLLLAVLNELNLRKVASWTWAGSPVILFGGLFFLAEAWGKHTFMHCGPYTKHLVSLSGGIVVLASTCLFS